MHDIDDLAHVLIDFRDFLRQGGAASGAHINALILHLARNRPATRYLFRLGAAQHAPGTVTTTGEGFGAALGRANKHIGIAAHIAWHQHRLPEVTIDLGELRMVWGGGAGGTLPMYTQPPWLAVNNVGLELANIMAHVVDDLDTQVPRRPLQDFFKGLADLVGDQLPIGKGKIRGAVHRTDILLGLRRGERRTAELAVRDSNPILRRGLLHKPERVVTNLIAKTARPR